MSDMNWLKDLPKFYQRQFEARGYDGLFDRTAEGRDSLSRRSFLKGMGAAAAGAAAAASLPAGRARAASTMGYMCWEGYNAPAIVVPFEKENDVKMNIDVIIDDPSAFGKLIAGAHRDVDVATLDSPWVQRFGPAGLCEFLNYDDFADTYANFYDQFQHPFEPLMWEGGITGLPTRWGWIGPIFNTNNYSYEYWKDYTPIFDSENKDKIAWMDFGDYPIFILALHAGIYPFKELEQSEKDEIRMLMRKLFANTRLLIGDLTLLQKGLVDGSIANQVGCGNYCASGARYNGHREIVSTVPEPLSDGFKRGAIWLEATAIIREPNNPEAAANWIRWCARDDIGKLLSLGSIVSPPTPNKRVEALYTDDEKDIIQMDYLWTAWEQSVFQYMMPDVDELMAMQQEEWTNAA